jgi:hypothetical protein
VLKQVTGDTHANVQVKVERTRTVEANYTTTQTYYNGTKLVRRNMSVKELLRLELNRIRFEF